MNICIFYCGGWVKVHATDISVWDVHIFGAVFSHMLAYRYQHGPHHNSNPSVTWRPAQGGQEQRNWP